ENWAILVSFSLLNFALWSYWIWQGLNRCFRNPITTIFSKGQSYLLTACFQVSLIGFTVPGYTYEHLSAKDWLFQHFMFLCALNFLLFLVLIGILSPHRQVLHDWARYRHQNQGKSLIKDLMFGEKSPALVAIGINLGIAITFISLWSLSSAAEFKYKTATLVSLAFAFTLVMLYAVLTQLLLFVRIKNNIIWAISALSATIFLPLIVLAIFQINPDKSLSFLWYFSVLAPIATYWEETPAMQIFVAALGQWTVIGLLTVQLTRKLRLAGESTTKALLQERKALPARNL
ncbi:MAG: ABC transporter permease, partial [Phormidium sp.]